MTTSAHTDLSECPTTAAEQPIFVGHLELLLVDVSSRFQVIVEPLAISFCRSPHICRLHPSPAFALPKIPRSTQRD